MKRTLPFLCLLLLPACHKKAPPPAQPAAIHVGAEDVVIVNDDRVVTGPALSGTLKAKDEATVRAQVAGTVLDVKADEGQRVQRGQLLARIDPGALASMASGAQSEVVTAQNALATAEKDQRRQETLYRDGIISKQQVEMARQATSNARGQLANARAQASSANVQLGRTTVEAPVSGVVSNRAVDDGDVVAQNGELLTIVDLSTLELQGSVPSEQLSALRIGLPVEFQVKGIPNRTFSGHISRINPSADPVTRQIEVFAEIPNDGQTLVEGLYAEGRLASMQRVGLAVPSAAIDRRMSQPAVVRVRNNIVERVPVTLGIVDDRNDRVEITSGVQAGDVLLAGASQQLAPGTHVEIAPAAFATPREQAR